MCHCSHVPQAAMKDGFCGEHRDTWPHDYDLAEAPASTLKADTLAKAMNIRDHQEAKIDHVQRWCMDLQQRIEVLELKSGGRGG